jgi:hypothetical protein
VRPIIETLNFFMMCGSRLRRCEGQRSRAHTAAAGVGVGAGIQSSSGALG